jgi:hypothetical protein
MIKGQCMAYKGSNYCSDWKHIENTFNCPYDIPGTQSAKELQQTAVMGAA